MKNTDLVFTKGKFYSKVTAVAGGYLTDESTYYMSLSDMFDRRVIYKKWDRSNLTVEFDVYLNQDDIKGGINGGMSHPWTVACTINKRDTPSDDQEDHIFFEYREPSSLKLDVKVVGGPYTVSRTKADIDDERQYILYQVDVTVEGGGNFVSVLTSSSNGNFSKSEQITEGTQKFTYTASAVFKDRSELPTIKCEGTLLDGSKVSADRVFALSSLF